MKTLIFALAALSTAPTLADTNDQPLRQATLTATIQKYTYALVNGLPTWNTSDVCTASGKVNVYDGTAGQIVQQPSDVALVQCDSTIAGAKTSVVVGGFVSLIKNPIAGHTTPLKTANVVISWGDRGDEQAQATGSAGSEVWGDLVTWIAPVESVAINNGTIGPPSASESFGAAITIVDASSR